MPLTVLIIDRTEKVLVSSNLKNWLLLGALLGVAGLSKYTAIVYVLSLIALFVLKKKYSEILRFPFWAGLWPPQWALGACHWVAVEQDYCRP